jgi:hypothetical protein
MQLACRRCGALVDGETEDTLVAAMMSHIDEAHPAHFARTSPDEVAQRRKSMEAHVRQMVVAQG